MLNPRAASVYLTLVPQFVGPRDSVLATTAALVAVHITMQTAWLSSWTMLVAGARRLLSVERFGQTLRRISGAVLIGVGVRTTAVARRL